MKVTKFEDLEIWQLARDLSKYVFRISSEGPFSNDYRFRDQIRSASGSIMDNIAEGFERGGNKEFLQFLSISKASCAEVRSQSYRAFDMAYIDENELNELLTKTDTLSRKIANMMKHLKVSPYKGPKFE